MCVSSAVEPWVDTPAKLCDNAGMRSAREATDQNAGTVAIARPLFVVGDLHGNYEACVQILLGLGVVNEQLHWQAREVDLVQLGDICDRGPNSRAIYELFMRLQLEAPACDSSFEVLLGNHEVMAAFGMEQYAGEQEAAGYARSRRSRGWKERRAAFAPGGFVFEWLAQRPVLHQVGPVVCAHGDLPVQLSTAGVEGLDRHLRKEFFRHVPPPGMQPAELPGSLFSDHMNVFWCRQASGRSREYGAHLQRFLRSNDASLYVCGHTPQTNGRFRVACAGAYLCIDTAMGFESEGLGTRTALVMRPGAAAEEWRFPRRRGGPAVPRRRSLGISVIAES